MSTFAMWDYNRINKKKEEQCKREGITVDRADEFRDMGDDSPLFRLVNYCFVFCRALVNITLIIMM